MTGGNLSAFITPKGNVRASFNNLPTNLYPSVVKYLNRSDIARLAVASPKFATWIRDPRHIKFLGGKAAQNTARLLATRILPNLPWVVPEPTNKVPLSVLERKFLENRGNYPGYRAKAYLRETRNKFRFGGRSGLRTPYDPLYRINFQSKNVGTQNGKSYGLGMRHFPTPQMLEYFQPTVYNTNRKTGLPTSTARKIAREMPTGSNYYKNWTYGLTYGNKFKAALARARQRIANKRRANNNRRN
jgi:hypothetical protein